MPTKADARARDRFRLAKKTPNASVVGRGLDAQDEREAAQDLGHPLARERTDACAEARAIDRAEPADVHDARPWQSCFSLSQSDVARHLREEECVVPRGRAARSRSRWLGGDTCTTLNIVNARARQLLDELLQMSAEDRALIAAELEASLEDAEVSPEQIERAWAEEIMRRAREVREGRSRGREGHEVLSEIRAELATIKR